MKMPEMPDIKGRVNSAASKAFAVLLAVIVSIMFLNSMLADRDGRSAVISADGSNEYMDSVSTDEEIRLKNILECISGVGKTHVMINDGGNKKTSAVFSSQNAYGNSAGEDAAGVIVVAEGGGDPAVRSRITDAVSTVCGVAPSDVIVFELKE